MSQTLDVHGKSITTYIAFHAAEALGSMADGSVLELQTDSTEAIDNDVRAWCRVTGNRLISAENGLGGICFRIEKHAVEKRRRSAALVISDPGLEELLSPLGFALAAALEGVEVSIYFQGPAVRILAKGFKAKLHGPSRPFSLFARRGLEKAGHVSPQGKIAELQTLGAHLYVCGPSMEHFRVSKDDLVYDGVTVAEYLTFMEVMERAEIHMFAQ